MAPESISINGKSYETSKYLRPWLSRVSDAEKAREEFLPAIRINRKFAAGKQHLDVNPRDGRVLDVRTRNIGGVPTKMVTSDRLGQYIQTAQGRLQANDYRPNFLAYSDSEDAGLITEQLNDSYHWCWDNEVMADVKVGQLLRLLIIDGTGAVRVKYDRRYGEVVGDFPIREGRPVMDSADAKKYVAEAAQKGETVPFATLREGKVSWEVLSMENFLTPAGMEYPEDFPWVVICKAVPLTEVFRRYGDLAAGQVEEEIESSASLTSGLGYSNEAKAKLQGRCFVYTGYEMPTSSYPKGRTVVFTKTNLLDVIEELPLSDHPKGPRHGIHFFRWQIIPGRFPGKAFIESGIGPQIIRNKRMTQIDMIIDRNMPKVFIEEQSLARPRTGEPMEIIEVHPGSPLPQVQSGVQPGQWMLQDIDLQDKNIEAALGMRSITLGQPPAGVAAYSAMALLSENDSLKLDPVSQDVSLGMVEVAWDTMEQMRNWPRAKNMELAGPDGALKAFEFDSTKIPKRYMCYAPKQGAQPRSVAAELQKVNDIWNAAIQVGKPLPLDWYYTSINAGKPQKLPASLGNTSRHKAELENIVMFHTGETVPVSPEDDDLAHGEIHHDFKQKMDALAMLGDKNATKVSNALGKHIAEHEKNAQATAASKQGGLQPTPPNTPPAPPGGVQGGPFGPVPGSPSAGTNGPGITAPPGAIPPLPGT